MKSDCKSIGNCAARIACGQGRMNLSLSLSDCYLIKIHNVSVLDVGLMLGLVKGHIVLQLKEAWHYV